MLLLFVQRSSAVCKVPLCSIRVGGLPGDLSHLCVSPGMGFGTSGTPLLPLLNV